MTEFIYALAFLVVGFIVGWKYREYTAIKSINAAIEHVENSNAIQIKIERIGDQIFVYNKATSEYMAHAKSREDLEKVLKEKFPGKNFGASPEDIGKLDESI